MVATPYILCNLKVHDVNLQQTSKLLCFPLLSPFKEIAVLKDVRSLQIIPGDLVKPFKSNFPSRLAQSRVELVEKLLPDLGAENSGFTLDNVMTVKDLEQAKCNYPNI